MGIYKTKFTVEKEFYQSFNKEIMASRSPVLTKLPLKDEKIIAPEVEIIAAELE